MSVAFYLDFDGVLADYDAGITKLGYYVDPEIKKELNRSGTGHPLKREMYERIKGTNFYAHLPLMPGALHLLARVTGHPLAFCTAAPKFGSSEDDYFLNPYWHGAAFHKRWWAEHVLMPALAGHVRPAAEYDLRRSRIDDKAFICTTSARKQQFIRWLPGEIQVLVDDRVANCDRWEAAGGVAILHTDISTTLAQIDGLLELERRAA